MGAPRYRRAATVRAREFGETLAIIDLATGREYALNAVGARIWRGLQQGEALDIIAEQLTTTYDVALDVARCDVERLVGELVTMGVLQLA